MGLVPRLASYLDGLVQTVIETIDLTVIGSSFNEGQRGDCDLGDLCHG